jgi:hypothetical protein
MVRRYLLVLDMDLLAADERLGLEPISYLLARQQEQPREVVVLSLADHRQARLPALELLLAAGSASARSQHRCGGRASHEPHRAPPEADRLPAASPAPGWPGPCGGTRLTGCGHAWGNG